MASKKTKRTQNGNDNAPAGFRKVESNFTGFWKPEGEGESIRGVVGKAIEVPTSDGRTSTFYPMAVTEGDVSSVFNIDGDQVKAGRGALVGFGGKMLLNFLGAHMGQEVYLIYRGLGNAKRGQSAPKMYDMYERGE